MKPFSQFFGLPVGISASFWFVMGILHLISDQFKSEKKQGRRKYTKRDIAVIIPAHNEEVVIRNCIRALTQTLAPKQIYVISDGSGDKTYRRALAEGCHVSSLTPGRGKARAMLYLIKRYRLFKRYKLIFIVDADTQIDKNFVKEALKLFENKKIGVVFGAVGIHWPNHLIPRLPLYFIAYRERLNKLLLVFFTYGQTWLPTNVPYVIPGFATIYKSEILSQLELDTPGLLIEDFNLAFQVHKKKLCKIGFTPEMIGWDQHPDNLRDYWSQVQRWNIGFFQTVKKNSVWPSFFWAALGLFSVEVILNSLFILLLPIILFFIAFHNFSSLDPTLLAIDEYYRSFVVYGELQLSDILIGSFLLDYLLTIIIGVAWRRPQFVLYGLFFFFMHYVTSLILISSLFPGFFSKSEGRWTSPARRDEKIVSVKI